MTKTAHTRQRANKLTLQRETLRRLDAIDLAAVRGGNDDPAVSFTCPPPITTRR